MAGPLDGVVEQGCSPQEGLLAEQDAVQAGQAFLRGVGGLQAVLLAALRAVPGLAGVVDPPDVVGSWGEGIRVNAHSIPLALPPPTATPADLSRGAASPPASAAGLRPG